jgi:hypothetical protein
VSGHVPFPHANNPDISAFRLLDSGSDTLASCWLLDSIHSQSARNVLCAILALFSLPMARNQQAICSRGAAVISSISESRQGWLTFLDACRLPALAVGLLLSL